MATRITLTIPPNLDEKQEHALRLLLQDAFYEFATKRDLPASEYVYKKYHGLPLDQFAAKLQLVRERIELARIMHSASFSADVKVDHVNHSACEIPCGPGCMRLGDEA